MWACIMEITESGRVLANSSFPPNDSQDSFNAHLD